MSTKSRPDQAPPSEVTQTSDGLTSKPRELTEEDFSTIIKVTQADSVPTQTPPEVTSQEAQGVAVWLNDKRINALWSTNETRNAWISVTGIGWKKLSNSNDSAIMALNILASFAKQNQSVVNYREEADGMIHEMYVW